jgi:DNA repair protein RecN (Recombination protein N)
MLKSLTVSNLAVIRHLSVEFQPGLNVITGETGAGKSLLVDALGLLLGGRADADLLRTGEERLRVEALLDIGACSAAAEWLEQAFPGQAEGGELLLRREVGGDGRSRAWIGSAPAPLATLRDIASRLIGIQGQHEQQSLASAAAQREWLDWFAGLEAERRKVGELHHEMTRLEERVHGAAAAERDRLQRLDLLRYQIQEIEQAGAQAGEDAALAAERERLRHIERLRAAAAEALALLSEAEPSASALVGRARSRLHEIAALDPGFGEGEALDSALAALGEASRGLAAYAEGLEADPGRLEQVEERRQQLEALKRKYGGSLEEVLAFAGARREEMQALERGEEDRREDSRRLEEAGRLYWEAAEVLSAARRAAAAELSRRVARELSALAMPRAGFSVDFTAPSPPWDAARPEGGPSGADEVRFLLAPNPGEEARPLASVASGGELSRLLLALHCCMEREAQPRTLVYDEVDAGVGADVAIAVGDRLRRVARRHQVLVVTHLHPIAAVADHHYRVEKAAVGGRTETRIRPLDAGDRVEEVLRMMGGEGAGSAGRRAAAEWVRRREVSRS